MSSDKEKDEEAVTKWVESLFSSMGSNDLEKYAALMSDDIILMPPNMPSLHGIESIKELVQPWFEEYTMTHEVGETEIRIDSELAYVRIEYKDSYWPKEGGDINSLDNKGLWILQKSPNDEWKAVRCMYNRNSPS
jgi:ketosteroid isomerase-like protein